MIDDFELSHSLLFTETAAPF